VKIPHYVLLILCLFPLTSDALWEPVNDPGDFDGIEFFVSRGGELFVGGAFGLVYKSDDLGDSWTLVGTGLEDVYSPITEMTFVGDDVIMSRSFQPYNFRCHFDGYSWGEWEEIPYQGNRLWSLLELDGVLYMLSSGTVFYSDDHGDFWAPLAVQPDGYIQKIFVLDGRLFASENLINDGEIFRYDDGTYPSWASISGPMGSSYLCSYAYFQNLVYVCVYHMGGIGTMWSSPDYGDNWEQITGLPTPYNINGMALTATGIVIGASGSNTDDQSIFFSEDFANWEDYTADLHWAARPVNDIVSHQGWLFKSGGTVSKWRAPQPSGSAAVDEDRQVLSRLSLAVHPNPMNSGSQIRFSVPNPETVQLSVRDLEGRLVQTLADRQFNAGDHTIRWTGRDASGRTVPRGTYWLHLTAGAQTRGYRVLVVE